MSIRTIVEKLLAQTRAAVDKREAGAGERYYSLVRRAAHGQELDPEKLLGELGKLGRDHATFERDVTAAVRRLEMATEAATLDQRLKELESTRAKIAAAEADYTAAIQAANKRYVETMPRLKDTERLQERAVKSAEDARAEVACTAPQGIVDRLKAAEKEAADARHKLWTLENELDKGERTPESLPTNLERSNTAAAAAGKARLGQAAERLIALRRELIPQARERLAAAETARGEAEAAALLV